MSAVVSARGPDGADTHAARRPVVGAALAAAAHLVLVGATLAALGHGLPAPVAGLGVLTVGAVATHLLLAHRLRAPVTLLGLGLLAAAVLEVATPGPWVTVLGDDRLTVGVPVLRSFAESTPLLVAVLGLAGLGESVLRGTRRHRARALGIGSLAALGVLAAAGLVGLSRGWASAPPMSLSAGGPALALLVLGAVFLVLRTRLVAPFVVLLVALTVACVAVWAQEPRFTDPAAGLLASATVWLALAILLGLGEALLRGVVVVVRRVRRTAESRVS